LATGAGLLAGHAAKSLQSAPSAAVSEAPAEQAPAPEEAPQV
jgi:hypothetical protein